MVLGMIFIFIYKMNINARGISLIYMYDQVFIYFYLIFNITSKKNKYSLTIRYLLK